MVRLARLVQLEEMGETVSLECKEKMEETDYRARLVRPELLDLLVLLEEMGERDNSVLPGKMAEMAN